MNEIKHKSAQIWLNFFNSYLYEHGLITEIERDKIANQICCISKDKTPLESIIKLKKS